MAFAADFFDLRCFLTFFARRVFFFEEVILFVLLLVFCLAAAVRVLPFVELPFPVSPAANAVVPSAMTNAIINPINFFISAFSFILFFVTDSFLESFFAKATSMRMPDRQDRFMSVLKEFRVFFGEQWCGAIAGSRKSATNSD